MEDFKSEKVRIFFNFFFKQRKPRSLLKSNSQHGLVKKKSCQINLISSSFLLKDKKPLGWEEAVDVIYVDLTFVSQKMLFNELGKQARGNCFKSRYITGWKP